MNSRIHDVLDGILPAEALSSEEMDRLLNLQGAIASVARHVQSDLVPEFSGRVMMELSRQSAPSTIALLRLRARSWARQVWAPRRITFEVRPAYGLAAAVAALVLISAPLPVRDGSVAVSDAGVLQRVPTAYVQFRLDSPGATQVELAGSFTDWQPEYAMQEREPGVWTTMVAVEPGVHEYLFVVDGQDWVPDPAAETMSDDFGGANSRLLVAAPLAQT